MTSGHLLSCVSFLPLSQRSSICPSVELRCQNRPGKRAGYCPQCSLKHKRRLTIVVFWRFRLLSKQFLCAWYGYIYLIVPYWYASAAYQPWFVFLRDTVEPKYPWRWVFSPKFSVTIAESDQWIDIVGYQDSRVGFWLANCEFGYGNKQ